MTLIKKDVVIAADGKLPSDFREAFGHKAHVTVCLHEDNHGGTRNTSRLMAFAGRIQAFRNMTETDEHRPFSGIFATATCHHPVLVTNDAGMRNVSDSKCRALAIKR